MNRQELMTAAQRALKRQHDFEDITGQYHYQNRGGREDLQSDAARGGYDRAEKFAQECRKGR